MGPCYVLAPFYLETWGPAAYLRWISATSIASLGSERTPGFSTENGGQCMWHPLRNNRMLAKISHQKVIGEKIIPLLNEKEHIYGSVSKPCTPGEHQNSW